MELCLTQTWAGSSSWFFRTSCAWRRKVHADLQVTISQQYDPLLGCNRNRQSQWVLLITNLYVKTKQKTKTQGSWSRGDIVIKGQNRDLNEVSCSRPRALPSTHSCFGLTGLCGQCAVWTRASPSESSWPQGEGAERTEGSLWTRTALLVSVVPSFSSCATKGSLCLLQGLLFFFTCF